MVIKNKNIKVFGRNLVTTYEHDIMSVLLSKIPKVDMAGIQITKITKENLYMCEGGAFSTKPLEGYLNQQPDKTEGWLFTRGGVKLGYLWIMFPGGNERLYKIRNIETYIFNVCVFPEVRGNGYAGMMFGWLANYLKSKGIDKIHLACRTDNISAQRAYAKIGMQTEERKRFYRVLKCNIPYYEL